MTFDDFVRRVGEICTDATYGEDNDGQVIVYTDRKLKGGEMIPFEVDE